MNSSSKGLIKHINSKARLRLGTGLSGAMTALLLLVPGSALAADECGPAGVTIVCPKSGTPYSTGITYTLPTGGPVADLTVALDPAVAIDTSGTDHNGITLINGSGGAISVSGPDSTIRTNGDRATGVFALSNAEHAQGDISIHVGDVSTGGYRSDGIFASTNYGGNNGNIDITAGHVEVAGVDSIGINASAYSGDVSVDVGSVKTSGDGDHGIWASSGYGNVSVNAGSVEVNGATGRGISAYSAGTTIVTAGDITTSGQGVVFGGDSDGVMAVGTKVVVDISGNVSTSGDYAVGVYAHSNHVQIDDTIGNPDIDVTVGNVATKGFASDAIHVVNTNHNGDSKVTVGNVSTEGDYAWGIYAASYYHNTAVKAGAVTTSGDNGTGIIALANGFVSVSADSVTTTGNDAAGIQTVSGAYSRLTGTTIDVGTVSTSGDNSRGIEAKSYYPGSTIQINAGTVSTKGDASDGIYAVGAGSITINTDTVTTSGNNSSGIYAVSQPAYAGQVLGAISIKANHVTTSGDGSTGIVAIADLPLTSISIDAKNISTSGYQSGGIYAGSRSGNVQIKASGLHTEGQYSAGIAAVSSYGNVSVAADHVETTGQSSTAIYAASNTGKITVVASDIKASGAYSTAIAAFGSGISITTSGHIDTGYIGQGIIAQSRDGGIELHNNAVVTTTYGGIDLVATGLRSNIVVDGTGGVLKTGDISHAGMGVLNVSGGNLSITQGDVSTTGSFSSGVVATLGNNPNGLDRANDTAHLVVDLQNVSTDGYDSTGVQLSNEAVTGVAGTGDATAIIHGSVSTKGLYSDGVSVYSANGLAAAQANIVTTAGDFSDGLHLDGKTVAVKATGAITTKGNNALGIGAYGGNGGIALSAGPITTTGIASVGIRATAPGDITISGTGPIVTSGSGSAGIQATEVARHRDLSTYIPYSEPFGPGSRVKEAPLTGKTITVAATAVTTTGDDSDGVFISGSTGTAKITTGTVAVSGANSVGIFGEDKAVSADTGNTASAKSTAIELRGFDSAALTVRGAATSGNGDAVQLQGSNVTLTVTGGGSIQGTTNGVVVDATPHVTPIVKYWGQLPNSYYAPEQPIPPVNPAPGKVAINNAGTISAGSGYAITVTGGSATVTNAGLVKGRVKFSGGDDVFANPGSFDAVGDSDFGGGNDLFQNSGTIRVLPGAPTAGRVSFLGLERFENSGLVDMRNGHVGDSFAVPGAFVGSGASKVGLDLTFGTTITADQLIVGGAATGTTAVVLNITNPNAATMTPAPIALVKTGAGSSADAFILANPDVGFIRYGLAFNAGTNSFGLIGSAGAPVYRTLKVSEGAANIWNRATDGWEAHLAQGRDARWAGVGEGRKVWGQIYGGVDTRDEMRSVATPGSAATLYDLGYRQTYYGAQIGVDLAESDSSVFGVTGSYVSSKQQGHGSADRTNHEAVSLGGYAGFHRGPFFASALAQYGHDWVKAANAQLGWSDKLKGDLYGGEVQVGVRFGSEKLYAEPLASLSYLHTDISDLHAFGQTIAFDGANGLRGKLGARVGASLDINGGGRALIYLTGTAVHEFQGEDGVTFLSGGGSSTIGNQRIGTYGQGSLGVNFVSAGKLSGFIQADGNAGGSFKGIGGRAGISLKF